MVDDNMLDGGRSIYSPSCMFCKHLQDRETYKCKAFELIPEEIWEGEIDHKKPYKGDNGIQFEKRK